MTTEDLSAGAADYARRAAEQIRADGRDLLWTMENGIVIRCKSLPITYLAALRQSFPAPQPPKMPGAGGLLEEVPDHPDYILALSQYQIDYDAQQNRLIWGMATSVESLPEGIYGPEEDGWIDTVRRASKLLGKPIAVEVEDKDLRYVDWLKYYAADNERDGWVLTFLPQRLAGLTLDEVQAAAEAFRYFTRRRADPESPAIRPAEDGDQGRKPGRRQRR